LVSLYFFHIFHHSIIQNEKCILKFNENNKITKKKNCYKNISLNQNNGISFYFFNFFLFLYINFKNINSNSNRNLKLINSDYFNLKKDSLNVVCVLNKNIFIQKDYQKDIFINLNQSIKNIFELFITRSNTKYKILKNVEKIGIDKSKERDWITTLNK
jgi:hypothetical protein